MWPWMQQQGFSPMYGMGGGFGQQMGGAAPWGQMPPQYQPQAPSGADAGNARLDKLRGRMTNLQEQWKGADTTQQAEIQGRMDKMQGRIKGLRQDRRHGQGMFAQPDGQAQPQQGQAGGASPWGGGFPQGFGQGPQGFGLNPYLMGGMQGGGMPWMQPQMMQGSYNPNANQGGAAPQAAKAPNPGATPVAPNPPQQGGWNPGTTPTAMGGNSFSSPFGDLVLSSTGNNNVFKRNGQSDNDLYHYDPSAGWKHMTADEYKGYGDYNYADPRTMGAAAGQKMQNWTMKNGMWQGQVGSGAYA